jgi:hypothetical protein
MNKDEIIKAALEQPEQEPTCPECKAAVLYECVACSSNNYPPKPQQEPVAWAVQGCSKMWRDEFAEIDAKAEAKRIGGTCVAYALYTTPPEAQWEHTSASFDEWWDGDVMPPSNPFAEGSAAYWAWAGWKAAQRKWQGLTDEEVVIASAEFDLKLKLAFRSGMYKAQIILRKKNDPTY